MLSYVNYLSEKGLLSQTGFILYYLFIFTVVVSVLHKLKKKYLHDLCLEIKLKSLHGGCKKHNFSLVFSSIGVLQRKEEGSEWHQDCLASLLKLLYQLGIVTEISEKGGDLSSDMQDSHRKRPRRFRKGSSDKLIILKLNEVSKK